MWLLIYFAFFPVQVFPVSTDIPYIVLSNNVNIRTDSSINSPIIRQVSFPEIINVYEIKGSGIFRDGILDIWARISDSNSEWINYFYISSFPFVVSSDAEYNYYSEGESTIIVHDFYLENNELYFKVEKNMNSYYHSDTEFNVLVSPFIENISIIDNPWTKLYKFCDGFREYIKNLGINNRGYGINISDKNVILEFGIQVGMNTQTIEDIFGTAYKIENNKYRYAVFYVGFGYYLEFTFQDSIVVNIRHEIEK
jgi:hypothetical protein